MNKITLDKVCVSNKKVEYKYTVFGDVSKYCIGNSFSIEYTENIESIPLSILTIPFVGNFLSFAFVFDVQIEVDSLDKSFFDSIDKIRDGYSKIYPNIVFKGKIFVKQLKEETVIQSDRVGLFFSLGVDSVTTLFRHLDDKPDLFSICGEDISDLNEWHKIENKIEEIAKEHSLKYFIAYSDFRKVFNYSKLDNYISKYNESWWHGFHHGIAIITHISPIAYLRGYKCSYISSTFDKTMKGKYTCASDPLIDNNVEFFNSKIIHDGYELTRQDKIKYIIDFNSRNLNKKIELRVCYFGKIKNCCNCEKCYSTALGIVAEGADPNDYGFDWGDDQIKKCKYDLKNTIVINQFKVNAYYKPIQMSFINNKINDSRYSWFINLNLDKFNRSPKKIIYTVLRYIKHSVFKL